MCHITNDLRANKRAEYFLLENVLKLLFLLLKLLTLYLEIKRNLKSGFGDQAKSLEK